MEEKVKKNGFEPKIVVFACNWCSYPAADAAGINRLQYPPNIRIIRTMCMGRVDPGYVFKALEMGADGVLVSGCHFEDCHYSFGARKAADQFKKVEKLVRLLGIEKERVRQEMISAAEFPKFARVIQEMVEQVRKVGPNPLGAAYKNKDIKFPEPEITQEKTAAAV